MPAPCRAATSRLQLRRAAAPRAAGSRSRAARPAPSHWPLERILHHRQQRRAAPRAGDDRVEARIGGDAQLVPRPGDEAERRHHPVERVDMGGQRGAAGLVPGHVEAGDELPPGAAARRGGGQPGLADRRRGAVPDRADPVDQRVQPRLLHPQRQRPGDRHVDDGAARARRRPSARAAPARPATAPSTARGGPSDPERPAWSLASESLAGAPIEASCWRGAERPA